MITNNAIMHCHNFTFSLGGDMKKMLLKIAPKNQTTQKNCANYADSLIRSIPIHLTIQHRYTQVGRYETGNTIMLIINITT